MVKNLPAMQKIKLYNLPNVYWDLTALSMLVCLDPKVHVFIHCNLLCLKVVKEILVYSGDLATQEELGGIFPTF